MNVAPFSPDLQGPKIRIGEVENNGVELVNGNKLIITTKDCVGTAKKIYITYQNFPKDVAVGDTVLLDDGKFAIEHYQNKQKG